jgi:transcriptional regulator with XRE-family HTH domain
MHTPTAAVIRLREDAFSAWAASRGLESASAAAEFLGVSHTTLTRVLSGETDPGEKFIAAALAATGSKFEELFEVAS